MIVRSGGGCKFFQLVRRVRPDEAAVPSDSVPITPRLRLPPAPSAAQSARQFHSRFSFRQTERVLQCSLQKSCESIRSDVVTESFSYRRRRELRITQK